MKIEVEKLNGAMNFNLWQVRMTDLLVFNGLEVTIEEQDSTISDANCKRLDKKALSTIRLYPSNNVLQEIYMKMTIAKLWRKAKALYLSTSIASQLVPKQQLLYLSCG